MHVVLCSLTGTAITMPFRERTAFAPAVADVRYAFGPSLQPFGLYALGSSEKLFYGEFVMDFTYETVPGTRRIFDSPLVSRIVINCFALISHTEFPYSCCVVYRGSAVETFEGCL